MNKINNFSRIERKSYGNKALMTMRASSKTRVNDAEILLRKFIKESISSGPALLNESDLVSFTDKDMAYIRKKWAILDEYFDRPGLLTESRRILAEGLLSDAWGGLKSMASFAGKKLIDGAVWVKQNAAKMGKKTIEIMKKIGGKLQDFVVYAIKLLPGGDIVLEFLSTIAGQLKEKIAEMQAAIGAKVNAFVKSAKERFIKFFVENVLRDDEMKADIYAAMGIDPQQLRQEAIIRGWRSRMLNEAGPPDESGGISTDLINQVKKKTGIEDAENTLKILGVVEKEPNFDSAAFLRGKAAKVVGNLIEFWLKLVEQNPEKYHKPLYRSGFFDDLGNTGFGLASTAILGILAASSMGWDEMVRYVQSIVRGFKSGTARPAGAKTSRSAAYLFLGNSKNEYDSSLFKQFITGIIEGSNLEVLIRVMVGDVSKIPTLVKRILGTIVSGIKKKINEATAPTLQSFGVQADAVDDDTEQEVNDTIEKYVDAAFGEGDSA